MKKLSLFIIIFISLSLCTCENEWMKEIMQKDTITITFDTDGGTPVPSKQVLQKGEKIKRPEDPTKGDQNNYLFAGWYTVINKKYMDPTSTSNRMEVDKENSILYYFDSVPTHDMTLYAGWENLQ